MEFGDKLKQLLKEKDETQTALSKYLNVERNTVSSYVNNKRQPNFDTLKKIAKYFDVTTDYLLGSNVEPVEIKVSEGKALVPVLGYVSCGEMCLAEENVIEYIEVSQELLDRGDYFALKLKGNSMSPKFLDGDLVVFRKQNTCNNGELAIACVEEDVEATFKKIVVSEEGVTLIALNPEYDPIFINNKKKVRILGVPVELRRNNF